MLRVIYNWHPSACFEENQWSFTCRDADQDGFVEITFHPAGKERNPQAITFGWDEKSGSYTAGNLPEKCHVRVIKSGESLEPIAKAGGLGYPLVRNPQDHDPNEPPQPSTQAPYVFQSFKDQPNETLAAFFNGVKRRDWSDGPKDSFPNRIPDRFWQLTPKQAALAIADANRTPNHREIWQLAVDDRQGITPPASGWLIFDWGSAGCSFPSSDCFALRFGVPEPTLTVLGSRVFGRHVWTDLPAHEVRRIKLTDSEARFIADTVFWLDRIRSHSSLKSNRSGYGGHSTGDGFAAISLFPADGEPRKLAASKIFTPARRRLIMLNRLNPVP